MDKQIGMDKKVAKKLLFDVIKVLKKYTLTPFLQQGTALGAYREKGFIEWDRDIDIALLYEDAVGKLDDVAIAIEKYGYRVVTTSKPMARTRVVKVFAEGAHLDIITLVLEGGMRTCQSTVSKYAIAMPNRLFVTGEEIIFLGKKCLVPSPLEEYLELHYGKEYMTPNPEDTKSRCRINDYRLGDLSLLRNHSPKHLQVTNEPGAYYAYLHSDVYSKYVLKPIMQFIPEQNSILDIGCGIGGLAQYIAGRQYVGIDGSTSALKQARSRFKDHKNMKFIDARIENYQWVGEPATYDTLVFGGIFLTIFKKEYWLDIVRGYAQAFGAKQFIICDLNKLDFNTFRRTFKQTGAYTVPPVKEKVKFRRNLLERHIESYEI